MSDPYMLYYSPDSANIIVRMILEELSVPYKDVLVDRGRQEEQSAAYRRLNPQGLIPVLVDGETVLFETAAIALYLADRHHVLAPCFDTHERAELYKWLFYLSNTLHADLRVAFYAHRYSTDEMGAHSVREASQRRLIQHFALLDEIVCRHGGPWLLPSGLSVCDFYLAACCRWSMLYPLAAPLTVGRPIERPHLRRLLESLEDRPSVVRACAKESIEAPFFTAPKRPTPKEGSVL